MEESQLYRPKWKEPIWKGYILYLFQLYGILEKAELRRQQKDQ